MTFRNAELHLVFQRNFEAIQDTDGELRVTGSLFAALDWFRVREGMESAEVQEVTEILLSAEMRTGLRRWYLRSGKEMNATASKFREHLSTLAGENF